MTRRPSPAARNTVGRGARIAALRPTLRVSGPLLVLVTVATAATPLAVTMVRSGDDITVSVVLLCLTAGASLGWALEDPAADMLDPLPIARQFRLGLRLSVASTIAVLVLGLAVAAVAVAGPGLPSDLGHRLPEMASAAAAAVAIGLIAARTGDRAIGPSAVTAGLLVPGVVAALAVRWPETLPTFMVNHVHHRWWWLAAVGAALAVRLATNEPR